MKLFLVICVRDWPFPKCLVFYAFNLIAYINEVYFYVRISMKYRKNKQESSLCSEIAFFENLNTESHLTHIFCTN